MKLHDDPTVPSQSGQRSEDPEDTGSGRELATVHRLPVPHDGAVLDAELVTEAEYRRLTSQKDRAIERYRGYRRDVVAVVGWSQRIVTHEVTRAAGRAVLRNGWHVIAGAGVVTRRWWEARTNSRYERMLRDAEAAGDLERLRDWEQRAEQAKQLRHQRRLDLLALPGKVAAALAITLATLIGGLLVIGVLLAAAHRDLAQVAAPLEALLRVVAWVADAVVVAWLPGLLVALLGGLGWLWHEGRTRARWTPAWMRSEQQQSETTESFAVINEDMLTRAVTHCKVSTLNQALRSGERLVFDVLPRQQGGGTYVQIRFPLGVTAADFLHPDKIERLAGNLGRHKHEVYPQRQPKADARVLDLWIADQGTMDRPAPPWPLWSDGGFDVFRDRVPWGVTMRGEQVEQGMLARHGLVGAVSKQGKTATMRIPALALALDPTVELRIADLKGDGDWSMFAPRAHTLIEGGAEEQADATCVMLEDLVAEMMRRYDRKRALGVRGGIPRSLSRQPGSGFHPIYAFVDECQVLYQAQHPVGGTKADARGWRAAKRLHDQARAVNIHLWQATQRPDPTAIPAPVREGAHVRIALYVANYEAAKMVLADAADMGARPQDLRPGRDRGTFVATGEVDGISEGMAFLIVKSHFVDTKDAYPVIDRAMDILRQHGRTVEQAPPAAGPAAPDIDHLADIAAAIGDVPRMRTQQVLNRLAEANRAVYGDWTFTHLHDALPEPAKPYKSDGNKVISRDRIHAAITERDNNHGDTGDESEGGEHLPGRDPGSSP